MRCNRLACASFCCEAGRDGWGVVAELETIRFSLSRGAVSGGEHHWSGPRGSDSIGGGLKGADKSCDSAMSRR